MNSDEDPFEDTTKDTDSISNVLSAIFEEKTQRQSPETKRKPVNIHNNCRNRNALFEYQNNYRKFIYPTDNDIRREMKDTENPNLNRLKSERNPSKINDNQINDLSPTFSEEFLREFDSSMIDYETDYWKINREETLVNRNSERNGFKTGSGRMIHRSEEAERKAKELFKDLIEDDGEIIRVDEERPSIVSEETGNYNNNNNPNQQRESIFDNDQSVITNQKPVPVVQNQNQQKKMTYPMTTETTDNTIKPLPACSGFQTGTGRVIARSEAAVTRARQLFASIDETFRRELPQLIDNNVSEERKENISPSKTEFSDRSMINDKINNITNDGIDQSVVTKQKSVSLGLNQNQTKTETTNNPVKPLLTCSGFQTGTGRAIVRSEAADTRARQLFASIDENLRRELSQLIDNNISVEKNENLVPSSIEFGDRSMTNDDKNTNDDARNNPEIEVDLDKSNDNDNWSEDFDFQDSFHESDGDNETEVSDQTVRQVAVIDLTKACSIETVDTRNELDQIDDFDWDKSFSQWTQIDSTSVATVSVPGGSEDQTASTSRASSNKIGESVLIQNNIVPQCNTTIRPQLSRFSEIRKDKKPLLSLKELIRMCPRPPVHASDETGSVINFHSCLDVQFQSGDNIHLRSVGDDVIVMPDAQGLIGWRQITECFMTCPGVERRLISDRWLENHYQMIVWKLISMRNRFGDFLSPDWMSPHHILLQLKYRYDREIDRVQRPALRRICEMDDNAGKRMVLVILSIERKSNESFEVFVSDGWYFVPAMLDRHLIDQILAKKLRIGTKIITCNAVWTGFDDPIILPTSSFPPNCGLKLYGNSTRRARFYAKLGYQPCASPFPVALGSLKPTGGIASLINVIVNRVYPVQYMETIHHKGQENPQRIFRNQRAEDIAQKRFDELKEQIINKTVEKMFTPTSSKNKKQKIGSAANLNNAEDIIKWLNNSIDQESAHAELSFNQQEILKSYKEQLVTSALDNQCPSRDVVRLLRVLVSGTQPSDVDSKQASILTIWKPTDELMSLIVEGTPIKIYSVSVTHSKLDSQFSSNSSMIALSNVSSTRFERDTEIHENLIATIYQARQTLSVINAYQFLNNATTSCEIDCIGFVLAISEPSSTVNDVWQQAVIGNIDDLDESLMIVKIWGGLQGNFITNIIQLGNFVRFINLQYRKSSSSTKNYPNSKTLISECHYGVHSNVAYVSRRWDFHVRKEEIYVKLAKYIPSLKLPGNNRHIKITSDRMNYSKSSPLLNRQKITELSFSKENSSKTLNTSVPHSPKMVTSTPKRLGMSGKRFNTSINSHTNTSNLLDSTKAESEASVNVLIEEPVVDASPTSRNTDWLDPDACIANLVKVRRRFSTSSPQYVPVKKKKN